MPFSLQARVVLLIDQPPIEHGVVTIEGPRIAAVGRTSDAASRVDLGDVALLPAFVNTHTHLEFSHLRRPLGRPGVRLVDWIRLVIAERGSRQASPAESVAAGYKDSIVAGVGGVGDIVSDVSSIPPGFNSDPWRSAQGAAACQPFLEVIGFSRARAESAWNALLERIDVFERNSPTARAGLSPHAPYTVSPALLERLVTRAVERRFPLAMHLAESREELELLTSGRGPFQELLEERSMWDASAIPLGSRPLDYLQRLAIAPRSLVIHGNYLDADESEFLAAHADRMSLVYCPRTHAYFQHSPYPLADLLAAGVHVALGTDSRASNPDLDLLAEMRHVARTHPHVAPNDILRMGTLNGAEALGWGTELGSLKPGKLANFVAVPLPEVGGRATASDLLAALLQSSQRVSRVWLRGEVTAR